VVYKMSYLLSPQFWPLYAVFSIFLVSLFLIYEKAGRSGFLIFVPVYNIVVFLEIINRPIWWTILLFIPFVNFFVGISLIEDLSEAFGKGGSSAMAKYYLSIFLLPVIAFGPSTYTKPTRY